MNPACWRERADERAAGPVPIMAIDVEVLERRCFFRLRLFPVDVAVVEVEVASVVMVVVQVLIVAIIYLVCDVEAK